MIRMSTSQATGVFRNGVLVLQMPTRNHKLAPSASIEVLMPLSVKAEGAKGDTGGAPGSLGNGLKIQYKAATPAQRASRLGSLIKQGYSEEEAIAEFERVEIERGVMDPKDSSATAPANKAATQRSESTSVWRMGFLLGNEKDGYKLSASGGIYGIEDGMLVRDLNPLGLPSLRPDHVQINGENCKRTKVPRFGANCLGPVYRLKSTPARLQNSEPCGWERGYLWFRSPRAMFMPADGELAPSLEASQRLTSNERFILTLSKVQTWDAVAEAEHKVGVFLKDLTGQ